MDPLWFIIVVPTVLAYPSGGPCGRVIPNHGGPIEDDGTFHLVFDPPRNGSYLLAGEKYTVTLGSYEDDNVPLGLAVSATFGEAEVISDCAATCTPKSRRTKVFIHHKKRGCPVVFTWTAKEEGEVDFDYTVVRKYSEWVNIRESFPVLTMETAALIFPE